MAQAHKYTSYLEKLCSDKVRFKWTKEDQNEFMAMKKILGTHVILSYPNFSEDFIIHTGDIKEQLRGGGIFQNKNPVAFFSNKLTSSKTYTAT